MKKYHIEGCECELCLECGYALKRKLKLRRRKHRIKISYNDFREIQLRARPDGTNLLI